MDFVLDNFQIQDLPHESEVVIVDNLIKEQLVLHGTFDASVWRDKESFHNSEHIRAVTEAATVYFKMTSRENDPLGVWADLDTWNHQNSHTHVSDGEFRQIALLAFGFHDTGNFSKLDENGSQVFLDKYTSKGAEERSKLILINAIESQNLDPATKEKYVKLSSILIDQTKFAEEIKMFGKFVKVIDQIGNDLFSQNEKRIIGLLNEMTTEDPKLYINPYFFYNFVRQMLPKYLNHDEPSRLLKIWGKKMPELVQKFDENILAVEVLKSMV